MDNQRMSHDTVHQSRAARLLSGVLAGLVAALVMTLLQALLRLVFGVADPPELIGDRVAPLLGVRLFSALIQALRGYNELKQLGVGSVLLGQLAVGVGAGVAYAVLTQRDRARRGATVSWLAVGARPVAIAAVLVGAAWLATIVLLWPVLGTHYGGLPDAPARIVTGLALAVEYALFGLVLVIAHRFLSRRSSASDDPGVSGSTMRRRALLVAGAGAVVAAASGGLLKTLFDRATFGYDGLWYIGPDILPITPNDRFYVVTKNVIDPSVNRDVWQLRIDGAVTRPQSYHYAELASLPSVDQETTLMCISNPVAGGLMSNAVWTGVSLRTLLAVAGPGADPAEALLHAVDGYTDTIPFSKAMEPTTLVVYAMNGQPLPDRHGFPVRLIVPGLYGEKSVKWLSRVELVDQPAKGFYETQGWGPDFEVPIHARFDGPDLGRPLSLGREIPLHGTAFAGSRGISLVEVSTDGGAGWKRATVVYRGGPLAWVMWAFPWRPERVGDLELIVRAQDSAGNAQIGRERGVVPTGSTGYHRVKVRVVEAAA